MAEQVRPTDPWIKAERCAVIVAHPDDETIWAGGTILLHTGIEWTIMTLCRKSDAERSEKFYRAVEQYGAKGYMADLDDGPEQKPLKPHIVQQAILQTLPVFGFDLIITHDRAGEYTRHLRHEEVARAVMTLRQDGDLHSRQLWTFAYNDGSRKYQPQPIMNADIFLRLPDDVYEQKKKIVTETYGFADDSFEAKAAGPAEAFWRFGQS